MISTSIALKIAQSHLADQHFAPIAKNSSGNIRIKKNTNVSFRGLGKQGYQCNGDYIFGYRRINLSSLRIRVPQKMPRLCEFCLHWCQRRRCGWFPLELELIGADHRTQAPTHVCVPQLCQPHILRSMWIAPVRASQARMAMQGFV